MLNEKINVLFWNIDGKPLVQNITRLVQVHNVRILLLAESAFQDEAAPLLQALNAPPRLPGMAEFYQPEETGKAEQGTQKQRRDSVQIFVNLPGAGWQRQVIHSRYTLWKVTLSDCPFLIAAAHFPSVQDDQMDGQRECALSLRLDLEQAEGDDPDPVSFVIGDLNANPFDAGIAGVYGLNATQSRRVAQSKMRTLNGHDYKFLYNPMWRFLGSDLPGTFYKRLSTPVCYDWFLLDQVLVRPAMIRLFDNEDNPPTPDVAILTADGSVELAAKNTSIPRDVFSDHLPLLFRFSLPGHEQP